MQEEVLLKSNKRFFVSIFVLIVVFGLGYFVANNGTLEDDSFSDSSNNSDCNVLAFSIQGYLSTYSNDKLTEEVELTSSEDIVYGLMEAEKDHNIKALMLVVDSSGGDGVAGQEISNALKSVTKPNVAIIRSIGASSAYWASTGAQRIFASNISDVGSIGVTASYLDESLRNEKEGFKYIELNSAKYKDLGDPSRTISKEERDIIIADLEKIHDVFVREVAENRNLEVSDVEKIANGLTFVGGDAFGLGLVDEIGDMRSAIKYIENLIGEEVDVCWY